MSLSRDMESWLISAWIVWPVGWIMFDEPVIALAAIVPEPQDDS